MTSKTLSSYKSQSEMINSSLLRKNPTFSTLAPSESSKTLGSSNSQVRLERSKSDHKYSRMGVESSPEKRVRLRDYLFLASTSSMRNNQKKKTLKSSIKETTCLKASISMLKKSKYEIPNDEMYKIVKREILRQYQQLIEDLQDKSSILSAEGQFEPTKEDLGTLYNIRRILSDRVQPACREISELNLRKQERVIKQIFNLGADMAHLQNSIPQQENEEDSKIIGKDSQKSNKTNKSRPSLPLGGMVQSMFFGGKQ